MRRGGPDCIVYRTNKPRCVRTRHLAGPSGEFAHPEIGTTCISPKRSLVLILFLPKVPYQASRASIGKRSA